MKTILLSLFLLPLAALPSSAGEPSGRVINEGGLRIFRAVEQKNNLCLSPYSIQAALAMAYAGAQGTTKSQMAEVLDFPTNPADLADQFQKLDAKLKASTGICGEGTSLHVANRLFGAKGFSFHPAFLKMLKLQFSAPLEEMDFQKNPSAAAGLINRWIEKQTENRIRNLIPANAVNKRTTLVLANALYLKMPWAEEFPAGATKELPFLASGRDKVNVPTMALTHSFGYLKLMGFQAVGVPFRGGEFQFLILLPVKRDRGDYPSPALLEKCARLPQQDVSLFLPKFKLEPPTMSLADTLQSLGINAAFDIPQGSANFDGIAPRQPDGYLRLSDVFHKTFFALDEKGVEAAAATAVIWSYVGLESTRRKPVELRVDRPFYFAIQHVPTATCLFLGKITDPR